MLDIVQQQPTGQFRIVDLAGSSVAPPLGIWKGPGVPCWAFSLERDPSLRKEITHMLLRAGPLLGDVRSKRHLLGDAFFG
jgi:hypothetical protein